MRLKDSFLGLGGPSNEVGHTDEAKKEMFKIFGREDVFDTPKPLRLLRRIIRIATDKNALVLDSFSGSATTGHAVLDANTRDGGTRRMILVEMEDYADTLTAERLRRVIRGYEFSGTQKTELMREKITWSKLRHASRLTEAVEAIENLHDNEYDRIRRQVKDGELIVTGEQSITERIEGLGGSFTYCTLGDPVELDKLLTGETLPPYGGIGAALFHMATNCALDPRAVREADCYLGEAGDRHVWLIYRAGLGLAEIAGGSADIESREGFRGNRPGEAPLCVRRGAVR